MVRWLHAKSPASVLSRGSSPADKSGFYAFDGGGNTVALSADSGDVVSQYSYDPYGNVQMAIKGIPNPFGYAGRFGVATDGASLYHMRAREYSSSLGQFLTDDPIKIRRGHQCSALCT